MTPFVIAAEIEAPGVKFQIRENEIPYEGDFVVSAAEVLLGAPLNPIPKPSMRRVSHGNNGFSRVGKVVFIPSNTPILFRSGPGRFRTITASFSRNAYDRATGRTGDWSNEELQDCHDIRNANIAWTLERMSLELQAPGFASQLLTEGLALSLAAELARHFNSYRDSPKRGEALSRGQIYRLKEYIDALDGRMPTLQELAGVCGLGSRTFERRFKARVGCTVSAWVAEQQIKRAKVLLRVGHFSVKQVAFRLGFSSASNFSAAFRRASGLTPSQFMSSV